MRAEKTATGRRKRGREEYEKEYHGPVLPTWKVVLRMIGFRRGLWLGNLVFLMIASEVGGVGGIYGLVLTNVPFFVSTLTLLRKNMLSHILKRPGASALSDSPGEAISRFRGDVFEISLFTLWLNDIDGLIVSEAAALVFMFTINPRIASFAVLPFFFVAFVSNAATKRIEMYRRASRKASGIVTGFIGEIFGAVQAIKVATAEKGVLAHFRKLNDERSKMAVRDRLFHEILHSIFRNSVNVSMGVILLLAGTAMQMGTFTVGDFALFVFYLGFLSEMTTFGGLLVARYKQIGVSINRMYRLMVDAPPEALVEFSEVYQKGPLPEIRYPEKTKQDRLEKLEVRGLTYRYPDSNNGIEGIDLCLARGSFTVITGRIGSGKTTLLRVLLGLLPMDGGEIRWNDRPVADAGSFFVPPRTAYTAQVPRLFSDSLRSNILMGMGKHDSQVIDAIGRAVLERDLEGLEHGLDTKVGPKGVKLSGGQMQRAAAARMFIRDPELLVFDDLSSALDVETERELWQRLFRREHAACLVVSHRKTVLKQADNIIVLKEGQVDARGRLDELLRVSEEMSHLWHGELAPETRGQPAPQVPLKTMSTATVAVA